MEAQRYLRQKGSTGRVYVYTPELAERDDMLECDIEYVNTRIEAAKRRIKEKEEFLKNATPMQPEVALKSKVLADLEAQDMALTEEIRRRGEAKETVEEEKAKTGAIETEQEADQAVIDQDPEIIKLKDMKKKDLIQYLEEEFGEKVDKLLGKEAIRQMAIERRTVRILET